LALKRTRATGGALVFFEAPISAPTRWCDIEGAYVLLSEAYRSEALKANSLGWQIFQRLGGLLDIANDEEAIADILVSLQ